MFYVVGDSGKKFGPADLNTLRGWVKENRILPNTMIESSDGSVIEARYIMGLFDAEGEAVEAEPEVIAPTPAAEDAPSNYPRTEVRDESNDAQIYGAWAWILSTLVIIPLCFPCSTVLLGPVAIFAAMKAKNGGYPLGQGVLRYAIASNVIGFVLGIVLTLLAPTLMDMMLKMK